ncbi:MAG: glycosyltransferase family 2 protein [Thermoleophilaceae bacterium]|nr:glycosyltransferase family 2 protein [Thermoleophilaceae bacterium]
MASVEEDEDIEVVVVDNWSAEPVDSAQVGARVIRLEDERGGPASARTAGLDATTAPYVFPLDADDLLLPGALGRMADLLDATPEAAFAWGDYELFGDYEGRYRGPARWLPWSLLYVNQYPVCSMFRREALVAAGGWREGGYEDWSLWLALAGLGLRGIASKRVVYRRRMHGPNRALAGQRARHSELYEMLHERHAALFARREELLHAEDPPVWKRIAYPIVFGKRAVLPFRFEAWLQRTAMKRGLSLGP